MLKWFVGQRPKLASFKNLSRSHLLKLAWEVKIPKYSLKSSVFPDWFPYITKKQPSYPYLAVCSWSVKWKQTQNGFSKLQFSLRLAPVLDWGKDLWVWKVSFPSASVGTMRDINSPYKYCQTIYGIHCANGTCNRTNNINNRTACPNRAHLESHALN